MGFYLRPAFVAGILAGASPRGEPALP